MTRRLLPILVLAFGLGGAATAETLNMPAAQSASEPGATTDTPASNADSGNPDAGMPPSDDAMALPPAEPAEAATQTEPAPEFTPPPPAPLASPNADGSYSIKMPGRGMTMDKVESTFGAPSQKYPDVGDPPITRWIYPGFTVYFEYQYVIDSVATLKAE